MYFQHLIMIGYFTRKQTKLTDALTSPEQHSLSGI